MTRHTLSLTNLGIPEHWPNHTVGFDRAFDMLQTVSGIAKSGSNYPPYSLIKKDDFNYELEMAVAGFSENNLEITTAKNRLSVVGLKPNADDTREYIVRGIAARDFNREFVLADTIVVREATLVNGILTIQLENVVPEEQKPRKITIGNAPTNPKTVLLTEEEQEQVRQERFKEKWQPAVDRLNEGFWNIKDQ